MLRVKREPDYQMDRGGCIKCATSDSRKKSGICWYPLSVRLINAKPGWHRGLALIRPRQEHLIPAGDFYFRQNNKPEGERKMIKTAIEKIVNKEDLTYEEAYETMNEIMGGMSTSTQNAAFLAALSTKNAGFETIDEITGCAAAMRDHATKVDKGDMEVLEIVGTGGDRAQSFNISTTSAFVIASAGIKVAKHGNRAASSKSGTADCLEALGANINLDPEKCVELLKSAGFCFFFAQKYHTSMKYVGPIRKELGFRTVFNILGPLTNPAQPDFYLLGVYDQYLAEPVAHVLKSLGAKHALVVYGEDKLDEISGSSETFVAELRPDGSITTYEIKPEDFGFERGTKDDIVGGTPAENAEITRGILEGKITGPKRNVVLMNAGAAIYAAGKAKTIEEGVGQAKYLIDSGKALETLNKFVEESNK